MSIEFLSSLWASRRYTLSWSAPLIWAPLLALKTVEMNCAYVALIMITYWFLETLPISVTALLPLAFFPVLGVMSSDDICRCYFNITLMVTLGSLIAAIAVESSNLHVRMALKVILIFGTSPRALLFGFMITTAFFSLWISNIAAITLMLPIIDAAMTQLANRQPEKLPTLSKESSPSDEDEGMTKEDHAKFRKGILLGVCYASNIGGTGTLTGTATNLVLNANLPDLQVSYSQWMIFNMPGLLVSLLATWLFLSIYFLNMRAYKNQETREKQIEVQIRQQYESLGGMTFPESAVCFLFALLLILWFFRKPDFIPGWTSFFTDDKKYIADQVPVILVIILFFMIPKNPWDLINSPPILDWKTAQKGVHWGVIILIGGGFALAKGSEESGLSLKISAFFHNAFGKLPPPLLCLMLILSAAMLTECTSNAATVTVLLPVVKPIASDLNIDLIYLMLPITIACSYSTMLPISSGTNAIVFEIAEMCNKDMIIPGIAVKMVCVFMLYTTLHTWGQFIFHFSY